MLQTIQSWVEYTFQGWWFHSQVTIIRKPSLSHLSASSHGLCLGPCRSPSFAECCLPMPACSQKSPCLSTTDSGPGTLASRRPASGPGTPYLLGEACHLGNRESTFTTLDDNRHTENSKCLFLKCFRWSGGHSREDLPHLSYDSWKRCQIPKLHLKGENKSSALMKQCAHRHK